MNIYKIFILNILVLFFFSCGGGNTATSQLFNIELDGNRSNFQQHETVGITLKNKQGKTLDKVVYFMDGKELALNNNAITFNISSLGNKTIEAKVYYEDTHGSVYKKVKVLSSTPPELYTYEIVNTFPHDIKAFTQGLEFHKDTLYETTGRKGESSLRKIDYKTGEVLQKVDLDNTFFGEGLSILNGKIYQLTWQSKSGFIYDLNSLEKVDSFKYGESKEGWGLCNDGKMLYKSDGTEKIWLLNPETLVEEGFIQTVTNKSIFNKANELEYVAGKIYANVWQKESMMIIDAKSGAIEGVINFGGLKEKVTKHDKLNVLNGVAYHPTRQSFFVTGKYWDKLFEVKIIKK